MKLWEILRFSIIYGNTICFNLYAVCPRKEGRKQYTVSIWADQAIKYARMEEKTRLKVLKYHKGSSFVESQKGLKIKQILWSNLTKQKYFL